MASEDFDREDGRGGTHSAPFEGWDCPCGSSEPGPEDLYCDDCLQHMRALYRREEVVR